MRMPPNPEPMSKPLDAGRLSIALPKSASSRSKTGSPQPTGTPRATPSTIPPTESPARRIFSISRIIFSAAALSGQRTILDSKSEEAKFADIESNIGRCADNAAAEKMIRLIEKMRRAGDSVGGIVEGVARGVPVGWGEPVFDRLEADLGKAMLSLPASKGFDIGSGFGGILMTGTQHNDPFRMKGGKVRTL